MEQVLLNLALNARDAMPIGGELVVRTDVVEIGSKAQTLDLPAGNYVLLSVTDTGGGMSDAVRARAFEPFFTTKERGAGTGLGLATVYGSVARAGGTVLIESALGRGTTFKIYLPHIAVKDLPREEVPVNRPSAGTETILVVEDEAGIRRIVQRVLERNGYEVIVAESSPQAIDLAQDFRGRIDLVLTDVVMPQLSGMEVAERIRLFRPDARVLFMSGYTDDVMAEHGLASAVQDYLPKPFTAEDLLVRVRSTLDELVERT